MEQTTVEWLEKNITLNMTIYDLLLLFEQAKHMEQAQLKSEYYRGLNEAINPPYYTEQ